MNVDIYDHAKLRTVMDSFHLAPNPGLVRVLCMSMGPSSVGVTAAMSHTLYQLVTASGCPPVYNEKGTPPGGLMDEANFHVFAMMLLLNVRLILQEPKEEIIKEPASIGNAPTANSILIQAAKFHPPNNQDTHESTTVQHLESTTSQDFYQVDPSTTEGASALFQISQTLFRKQNW
jgi:hypothetical protein